MTFRAARPEDRDRLCDAVGQRPWPIAFCRPWTPEDVAEMWRERVAWGFEEALADATMEIILAEEGPVWALLQHGVDEATTGKVNAHLRKPCWPADPALIRETAARAKARGAVRLAIDVDVGATALEQACETAGMVAETQRVVRRLDDPDSGIRVPATVRTRAADTSDQLFLLALSTECVPFMFHARRADEVEAVRARFFDVYAMLPIADESDLRAWIAHAPSGVAAGAILIQPEGEKAVDGRWESYIYDVSVEQRHWGRWIGPALVDTAVHALSAEGYGYLSGDVSTDNLRIQSLARRMKFATESQRWYLEL